MKRLLTMFALITLVLFCCLSLAMADAGGTTPAPMSTLDIILYAVTGLLSLLFGISERLARNPNTQANGIWDFFVKARSALAVGAPIMGEAIKSLAPLMPASVAPIADTVATGIEELAKEVQPPAPAAASAPADTVASAAPAPTAEQVAAAQATLAAAGVAVPTPAAPVS